MPEIVVTVKNKMAVGDGSVIVCNNSDYVVRFALDSEWDALALRTMRIVYDSYSHTDIAFSGDTVALPAIIDRTSIGIGLYSGDIHTSTCAMFDCERSVMGKNSNAVEPPSSDVYNEIVEMINDGRLKGDKGTDGTNGADGANGADGVTFTPSVDSAGNLSWTNDGGLSNPDTVNIKGATGAAGERGEQGIPGEPGAQGAKGDKGDKGADGAPGKDGSDANVTAQNIEAALGYAPVKDVQVAGTSVMTDGVANVPIATKTVNGVMRPDFYGIGVSATGILYIQNTSNINITNRVSSAPLTAYNLDYAVKAAMCDGKGAAWTDAEQKAARERMGIPGDYELIEEITISEAITSFIRESHPDGTPYSLAGFFCVITSPGVDNAVALNQNIFAGGTSLYNYGVRSVDTAVNAKSVLFACVNNKILHAEQYPVGVAYEFANAERFAKKFVPDGSPITKVTFAGNIPVNTKISIYGVRA